MDIPIIRIEMDRLRKITMSHMLQHSDEINEMVQMALENTLTEEWVKTSIQQAVNKTVQNAIDGLADNYQLKSAVDQALGQALSQMIEGMGNTGGNDQ